MSVVIADRTTRITTDEHVRRFGQLSARISCTAARSSSCVNGFGRTLRTRSRYAASFDAPSPRLNRAEISMIGALYNSCIPRISAPAPRGLDTLAMTRRALRCRSSTRGRDHGKSRLREPPFHELPDKIVGFDDNDVTRLFQLLPFPCMPTDAATCSHVATLPLALRTSRLTAVRREPGSNMSADTNRHVRYIFGMRLPVTVIGPGSLRQ